MGYNSDENVGEDTEGQEQPSYPNFSSYFIINEVYFMRFFILFVIEQCFYCFRFFKSAMIC